MVHLSRSVSVFIDGCGARFSIMSRIDGRGSMAVFHAKQEARWLTAAVLSRVTDDSERETATPWVSEQLCAKSWRVHDLMVHIHSYVS